MNVSTLNGLDLGHPLKVHSQGLKKILSAGWLVCPAGRNKKVSNAKLAYGENKQGFNWRAICGAVRNKTSCSYHLA